MSVLLLQTGGADNLLLQDGSGLLLQDSAAGGPVTGDASITLGDLTCSATGALALSGSAAITLGALTAAGTGTLGLSGSASATLGSLALSATGTLALAGTSAVTLDPLTLVSTGTLSDGPSGSASITLDPLTLTATGVLALAGSAGVTLGSLTLSAAGTLAITGTASVVLGPLTLVSAGTLGSGPVVVFPGGTFRRAEWTWPRTFARAGWAWPRVWSYVVNSVPPVTCYVIGDDDRDFLFDFSHSPEMAGGDTIASAVILGGSSLTFGAATPTDAVRDGIEAGKAVQVRISGWVAGSTYTFACRVTLASGRKLTIPARLVASAAY